MNDDDPADPLIAKLAQHVTTLHARADALQSVLLATIVALGQRSKRDAAQIERVALTACEAFCQQREKEGVAPAQIDAYRRNVETILLSVRAALTGKAQ